MAVRVLTVFLAVTVVVLTVKAGPFSELVLYTFMMIHFATLLLNTWVTKAVRVLTVALAVRIVLPRT